MTQCEHNDVARCVLGTVQLGMAYGIANTTGQPALEVAVAMVGEALAQGIYYFDTAQGYGVSERVLGYALKCNNARARARVITKLPPKLPASAAAIDACIQYSLRILGVPCLYAIMLHREEQLNLLDGAIGQRLECCLNQGVTKHIGISVYTPEVGFVALQHPLITVVQLPSSVFDRRFARAGVFAEADRLGKEIHVRSALLQGILCMPPANLPLHLAALSPVLEQLQCICLAHGITTRQGALAWILHEYPRVRLLFGAETVGQIHDNVSLVHVWRSFAETLYTAIDELEVPQTPALLNPALWEK